MCVPEFYGWRDHVHGGATYVVGSHVLQGITCVTGSHVWQDAAQLS